MATVCHLRTWARASQGVTQHRCGVEGTSEALLGATWHPLGAEPRPGVPGHLELVTGSGGWCWGSPGPPGDTQDQPEHRLRDASRVIHEIPEKGAGQATPDTPRGTSSSDRTLAGVVTPRWF